MSQALEYLLPTVVHHLSGDFSRSEASKDTASPLAEKNKVLSAYSPDVPDEGSAHRWRRCVELWRRLLSSDRLFLALLYHSGSLWAEEWHSSEDEERVEGVSQRRSWSEAVMWFLQLHDEDMTAHAHGNEDNESGNNHPSGASGDRVGGVHIYSSDESAAQRAAMGLLGEWFGIVDSCGPRFSRAYYFSCALKISALVSNATIIEDTPHLHGIIAREPRSATQFIAFHSILCCLLVEEAQGRPLYLPPPFFLLSFNAIGRGSRVAVWLPRDSGGEFHSCEVSSAGVLFSAAGDLLLGVRLLDEAYTRHMERSGVLPRLRGDEERRRGRGRIAAAAAEPKRQWSALQRATGGALRIDSLRARCVVAAAPSATPAAAANGAKTVKSAAGHGASAEDRGAVHGQGSSYNNSNNKNYSGSGVRRRAGAAPTGAAESAGGDESAYGMSPLSRNPRRTFARDAIATIALYLTITARRLIGCRGTFVDSSSSSSSKQSFHRPSTPAGVAAFSSAAKELEALVECAVHLLLAALMLCHALPSDFAPHVDAWAVEVTSHAADLVLATPKPIARNLRALGFALCLSPRPPQSLLVAVGVFATLARRERDGVGWWEAFKTSVLRDRVISGQLHAATQDLAERVERDLRGAPHARIRKHAQQQQKQRRQKQQQQQQQQEEEQEQTEEEEEEEEAAKQQQQQAGEKKDKRKHKTVQEESARAKETETVTAVGAAGPPPIPVGIRSARTVSVVDTKDIRMALWWTLEQQATEEIDAI